MVIKFPSSSTANPDVAYLRADPVLKTIERLSRRIEERLGPGRSLQAMCDRLRDLAADAQEKSRWIARPDWRLRIWSGAVLLVLFVLIAAPFRILGFDWQHLDEFSEFITVLEPGVNVIVLYAAAVIFVMSLETRIKRRRAVKALHELRSLAHVIDMHQLTKDPHRIRSGVSPTPSSPKQELSLPDLCRYLDYCSELLALVGKVAALYVQRFNDPVADASASEVEQLCTALSRKIWQKLIVVSGDMPGMIKSDAE